MGAGRKGEGVLKAHRVAWTLTHGEIPEGQSVCHSCDNPPCCNPDHLFLGTPADNAADMVRKGRTASGDRNGSRTHPARVPRGDRHHSRTHPEALPRGEKHPNAKITREQVAQIRAALGAGVFQEEIASRFGISQTMVSKIKRGLSWRDA
jgi:hypothetical protein